MVTREQIAALFERETIAEVVPSREAFEKRLLNGDPMHVYFGIDPTADKIHLGHVQNLLFLEDLRSLGVKVTVLFGSFTGMVGDPSERDGVRSELSEKQVRENMRTWKRQISPILNLSWRSGARIDHNARWYRKMSLTTFLSLLREVTAQQLLERDMFQKRLEDGKPLHAHELIYPILQGYDSVMLEADGELCGTDQTFNALVGRTFARRFADREKVVIAMNLLQADGVLMSKSSGTGVFVDIESGGADRMFGAVMAVPDAFVIPIYKACTRVSMQDIASLADRSGSAMRDTKMQLAQEIVSLFWGKGVAAAASDRYTQQFQKGEVPDDVPSITDTGGSTLLDVVAEHGAVSRSDARRKIAQGAVSVDGKKVTDVSYVIASGDRVLKVGRHLFHLS
ncbi:MAG: tyrosine--tRNA ligase [Candidatus Kaiserbacteria bacterium]|nr:tyrosine--tRNA ligase [Candidatus Kaiserbacteria bacterium]